MEYLTTRQAGRILGVNDSRVRQFILEGRLPAKKFGTVWMIRNKDLDKIKNRKRGRPGQGPHLKEHNGRFVMSFRDAHGRRRQITLPKGTTKPEAKQFVRKIEKNNLRTRPLESKSGNPDRSPEGKPPGGK